MAVAREASCPLRKLLTKVGRIPGLLPPQQPFDFYEEAERDSRSPAEAAITTQPQLAKRRISPHTVRRTTAMHLLQSGVDISVIVLWLGHESPTTTAL